MGVKYVGSIFVLVICIFSKLWRALVSWFVAAILCLGTPLCERDYLCECVEGVF